MKTVTAIAATVALFATASSFASPSLKFVAANENVESQVCVTAANQGLKAAKEVGTELGLSKYEVSDLVCNGRSIASFSLKYQEHQEVFEAVSTES